MERGGGSTAAGCHARGLLRARLGGLARTLDRDERDESSEGLDQRPHGLDQVARQRNQILERLEPLAAPARGLAMPFDSTGMTWKDSPTHVYVNVPMTKEALKAMNLRAFTDGDNLTLTTDDGVLVQSPPPPLHRRVARASYAGL